MGAKRIKVLYDILSPSIPPCFDAFPEHGFRKVMRFDPDGTWGPYAAPRYMAKMVHVKDRAGCIEFLRRAAAMLRAAADPKPGEYLVFEWKLPEPPGGSTLAGMMSRLKAKNPCSNILSPTCSTIPRRSPIRTGRPRSASDTS